MYIFVYLHDKIYVFYSEANIQFLLRGGGETINIKFICNKKNLIL